MLCITSPGHGSGKVEKLEDLRNGSPEELLQLAQTIVREFALTSAIYGMSVKKSATKDALQLKSMQFVHDTLHYIELDKAIMNGEIGTILWCGTLNGRYFCTVAKSAGRQLDTQNKPSIRVETEQLKD